MAVDTKAPERIEWEYTSHYRHNDPLGTAGANCPACQADRRNHERFAALQKRYEEAMEALRPFAAFVDVLSPADADDEIWTDGSFGDATEEVYRAVTVEDFRRAQAIMLRHKEGV